MRGQILGCKPNDLQSLYLHCHVDFLTGLLSGWMWFVNSSMLLANVWVTLLSAESISKQQTSEMAYRILLSLDV